MSEPTEGEQDKLVTRIMRLTTQIEVCMNNHDWSTAAMHSKELGITLHKLYAMIEQGYNATIEAG